MTFQKFRKFRMRLSLGTLIYTRIVATVLMLTVATCPLAFALERGKQAGEKVLRETALRFVDEERVDSLLGQFKALDINSLVSNLMRGSNSATFELQGQTYLFEQLAFNGVVASGLVTIHDPNGEMVTQVDIANITVPNLTNRNQVDFSTSTLTPGGTLTHDGTLVGIRGDPGKAIALVSTEKQDTRPIAVDFSGFAKSDSTTAGMIPWVTVSELANPFSVEGEGSVAVAVADDALIIAVVVVFVLLTCFMFGWWGCA